MRIAVKIDSTRESAPVKLEERVAIALSTPEAIVRYGGLSLGESWSLINGIRRYRQDDGEIRWLVRDNRGLIGLPIWIDRKTTRGTFQRFAIGPSDKFEDNCWIEILQMPFASKPAKSRSRS